MLYGTEQNLTTMLYIELFLKQTTWQKLKKKKKNKEEEEEEIKKETLHREIEQKQKNPTTSGWNETIEYMLELQDNHLCVCVVIEKKSFSHLPRFSERK